MKDFFAKHQKSIISYCGVAVVLALVGLLWLAMGRSGSGKDYTSDNNTEWMSIDQLRDWIEKNRIKIGSI